MLVLCLKDGWGLLCEPLAFLRGCSLFRTSALALCLKDWWGLFCEALVFLRGCSLFVLTEYFVPSGGLNQEALFGTNLCLPFVSMRVGRPWATCFEE